jgi:hypothetical protein
VHAHLLEGLTGPGRLQIPSAESASDDFASTDQKHIHHRCFRTNSVHHTLKELNSWPRSCTRPGPPSLPSPFEACCCAEDPHATTAAAIHLFTLTNHAKKEPTRLSSLPPPHSHPYARPPATCAHCSPPAHFNVAQMTLMQPTTAAAAQSINVTKRRLPPPPLPYEGCWSAAPHTNYNHSAGSNPLV